MRGHFSSIFFFSRGKKGSYVPPLEQKKPQPPPQKGGENGFNQAIELSADALANVKFVQEKRLISKFFDEISQDTGKFVFGVADTLACLEMGAVETLIVWESLDVNRYTLMNTVSGATEIKVRREKGVGDKREGGREERERERELREREREKKQRERRNVTFQKKKNSPFLFFFFSFPSSSKKTKNKNQNTRS